MKGRVLRNQIKLAKLVASHELLIARCAPEMSPDPVMKITRFLGRILFWGPLPYAKDLGTYEPALNR